MIKQKLFCMKLFQNGSSNVVKEVQFQHISKQESDFLIRQ